MRADPDFGTERLCDFKAAGQAGANVAAEVPGIGCAAEGVEEGCQRQGARPWKKVRGYVGCDV